MTVGKTLLDHANALAVWAHYTDVALLITDTSLAGDGPMVLAANPSFLEQTGLKEARLIGHPIGRHVDGDARGLLLRNLEGVGPEPLRLQSRLRLDGALRRATWDVLQVMDDEGTVTQWIWVTRSLARAAASDATPPAASRRAASPRGNGERLLVVDDDASVVDVTCRVLEKGGYRPVGVTSSVEGIKHVNQYLHEFHAVLTDIMMPDVDGEEFVFHIRSRKPELPIMVITGYMDDDRIDSLKHLGVQKILWKPLKFDELLTAVDEVLHPPQA